LEKQRKEIVKFLKANDINKLIILSDKYIESFPDDYFGWNILGLINEKKENFNEALNYYTKAEKLNNDQLNVKINISRVFLRLSEIDNAINILGDVLLLDKKNIHAYDLLSQIYYVQKNYKQTIKVLSKAIEVEKNNTSFLIRIGTSYLALKQFDKAKSCFETLTSLQPDISSNHYYLGGANYNLGRMKDAVKSYAKSLEIESDAISLFALNQSFKDSNLKYEDLKSEIDIFNSSIQDTVIIEN
tara:strand:+ start:1023 stop:1754 length:732 start_codon:yes stop_codon:yes gene_type:complete